MTGLLSGAGGACRRLVMLRQSNWTSRQPAVPAALVIPPQQQHYHIGQGDVWFRNSSNRCMSSDGGIPEIVSREDLVEEASALTKSLYRTCLRSVRVIRWGNAFDDKEFEKREAEFANPSSSSGGTGVISMAPPPDREDELRSRSAYYQSYAREYFVQESDCLDNDPLREKDIRRYLYYLRKGEKDRKWLLGDMMFKDPYKDTSLDHDRIQRFEKMAKRYLGEDDDEESEPQQPIPTSDNFFGEDDDTDPEWFKNKYPHLK